MRDNPVQNSASLRMAEPSDTAGHWNITENGALTCRLTLFAKRVEAVNGYRLEDADACLTRIAGGVVAGWRPAPDGIELVGADRLTLLLFADQGDGTASARGMVLRRK